MHTSAQRRTQKRRRAEMSRVSISTFTSASPFVSAQQGATRRTCTQRPGIETTSGSRSPSNTSFPTDPSQTSSKESSPTTKTRPRQLTSWASATVETSRPSLRRHPGSNRSRTATSLPCEHSSRNPSPVIPYSVSPTSQRTTRWVSTQNSPAARSTTSFSANCGRNMKSE